jgi:hypothetical protein
MGYERARGARSNLAAVAAAGVVSVCAGRANAGDLALAAIPAEEAGKPQEPASAPEAPAGPSPATLLAGEPGWQLGFFGFAELDGDYDTTQSFTDTVLNATISRPHTYAGDNSRFQGSPRDSRFGYKVTAPAFEGMKASALMEFDFFALAPPNATQDQTYFAVPFRLRQYYARLETPIIDVLAGQTNDLYGWGGAGFYPSTPARLGVLGEVFHRNSQLRLTKVIGGKAAALEIAVAGVRPADRDSAVPDLQAGMKLSFKGWQGASAQGPRRTTKAPMALAVSAIGRRLSVTDFSTVPGDNHVVYGGGVAADAFIPIIPARGDDLSNTISIVGEFSKGTGVADLYLNLTGGVLFPSLPNPHNTLPAPSYTPNLDQGIVTYDANGALHTVDWQGWMVAAQYHLPPRHGKMLWVSGTYSRVYSSNAVTLTPIFGQPFVWNKGEYVDATLWWDITPNFQMALSYQRQTETFGDAVSATNNRGEGAWWFYF